ncbi:MAG: DNA polymerase III subunit alpha, partial [Desulfobacterales bacterium]|nr:DNA polymerase III subunit alpha [Desulfobacterales bacterium]
FDDIIALVALYRPGPLDSGMVDDFVERKHGRKAVEYPIPQLEPILKETYGVIVYQEQVMKIGGVLANYSMSEADDLRKAMGKKIAEILAKHRARFMEGTAENGIPADKAKNLFDLIEKFGGYGFNKSHSAAYALIAYQTAYLKAHFRVEFLAALLTSEMHSSDGVVKYIAECRDGGVPVLPPEINESDKSFAVNNEQIRFGLVAVKNVGEGAIESVLEERKSGPYANLLDFCERVDFKKVNKRVLESLIKCGAFDSFGEHRSSMMASLEEVVDYGQRVQKEKSDPQMGLFDMGGGDSGKAVNAPTMAKIEEWEESQRLTLEKEALGFYISGHPLNKWESLLKQFTNTDALVIKEATDKQVVRIGGIVQSIRTLRTKKGDMMAFVLIEDMNGAVEAVVFPEAYAQAQDLLAIDEAVLVQGQVQRDEKAVKIIADVVVAMDKAEETWTASIRLNIDVNRADRSLLEQLKEALKRHPGSCPVYLHFQDPKKFETVVSLPDPYKLAAGAALTREMNALLGPNSLATVCAPAKAQVNDKRRNKFRR